MDIKAFLALQLKLVYSAPASVAVDTKSTEILAANTRRLYACIVNDCSDVIYLAIGSDAVINKGIRINANGGSFEMTKLNLSAQAINGICVSQGSVTVQEAV